MTSIPDLIFNTPTLAALLTALIYAIVRSQRGLSYHEYRLLHRCKYALFRALDSTARRYGRPLVRLKGYRNDSEFVATASYRPRTVARRLAAAGLSYHFLSTAKRRRTPWGRQDAFAHLVAIHDDDTQTEVFLFSTANGGTDLYAHHETAVTDPEGHHLTEQTPGDPRGVIKTEVIA
jgi:hypothetical protein